MAKRRRKTARFKFPFRLTYNLPAFITLSLGVLIGIGVSQYQGQSWQHTTPATHIQACFTPGQDCTHLIVQAINSAKSSLHVQAYSVTSPEIAQALIEAKQRGIGVSLLVDRSQENAHHSQVRNLAASGIPVLIDRVPGIPHNKTIIIDETSLLTGSYNFTTAAQTRNGENLLWIHDAQLAHLYLQNWQIRKNHAKSLEPVKSAPSLP